MLVVDDEASVREVLGQYLRLEGFEVLATEDGASALALSQATPPDLIILDLMLPGVNGIEVCRRLRAASAVPIIMLTARSDEADKLEGFRAGNVARSIARVETGARRIAVGDYAFRIAERDTAGTDELARLARWFNAMAANVEQAFTRRDRAEADRRQMLAALSHDLRTPLTSIRAMIESIDDGVTTDDATVRRYQRAIRGEVRRLGTLLDELFELSRLEAGTLALTHERIGVDDLVSDTLEAFHEQAERREVRLFGRVEADLPPVAGDAKQIARVLANLVQNALRYTPAGGATYIAAERSRDPAEASAIVVWVADSGPGIAAGDLARIFEPTYRGDSARARPGNGADSLDDGSGAGLGLAIARGIIELHGGRIWAVSPLPTHLRSHPLPLVADPDVPFRGTALCFTLPFAP